MGRTESRFAGGLQSRVARRVAILFVISAIVPLVVLAVVTTRRTTAHLERQAAERIHHDLKSVMMEALGRLDLRVSTVRLFGMALASDSESAPIRSQLDGLFPVVPRVLTFVPDTGPEVVFGEARRLPTPAEPERQLLRDGRPVLVPHDFGPNDRTHLIYVPVEGGARSGLMVASIDYVELLGLDLPDPLPPDSEVCAFSDVRLLVCSDGVDPALAELVTKVSADQQSLIPSADGPRVALARTVPLRWKYASPPWTLAILRPEATTRAVLSTFLWDFWKVLVLALLVVSLLVVSSVRRQLRPLVALSAATRRLGRRDFSTPVSVSSGDEFEELGDAFNTLSSELSRQFEELEAFSLGTLEALARTIDAKSHWTAGHSRRVTDMAVDLAIEMGLPENDVTLLRRGGLVHDIGKLATPPEILDKPSRLTPDEMRIMRDHTVQGVHILEPIPAFRPLLPIVLQHHERWDGGGYPHGVAGTDIALTARVLAVADVYDAMRSDRPYRAGLPFANVVAAIRAHAGTHFDPEVVRAFDRLLAKQGHNSVARLAG